MLNSRQWMAAARAVLVGAMTGATLWSPVQASTLPPGFQENPVITGRSEPTAIRFAPNGHVFVAEKSGLLWLYEGLSDSSPTIVVDLRTQTHNFWDRGLVGVAVSPNYPADPSVYVSYTLDAYADGTYPRWGTPGQSADGCPNPPGATGSGCVVYGRLSRITVNQSTLIGTETPLISGNWCQQYPSHSVDDLMFGADGYLYMSAGDGANFGTADWGQLGNPPNPCGDPANQGGALRTQDILTPADPTGFSGSVLRVDVSGGGIAAAPGNPLVGNGVADDDYVIASGLRNPFRMTQRPGTNEIWLSDVGWGTWEEINVIPSAAAPVEDFGWPCYEGGNGVNAQMGSYANVPLCQNVYSGNIPAGIVMQASHYGYMHSASVVAGDGCPTGGSSVTGLAFNNNNRYPALYNNALFFADSSRRCAWTMFADGSGVPDPSNIQFLISNAAGRVVDLQMGPDGYLYYVDFDGGRVFRIDYFANNSPPTAGITATPANGPVPLLVQFDGSMSSDPEDGSNLLYAWDLDGDGQYDDSTVAQPTWTYNQPGTYAASLKVTDSGGLTNTAGVLINAGSSPPTVTITSPPSGATWAVGDLINFAGQAQDSQGQLLPPAALSWDIILHHCYEEAECHTHPVTSLPGVASGSFDAPDHEFPSFLELRLTANPPATDWWNTAWTRRLKLTLDNSGQAENLSDFQLLVALNGTRLTYADAQANGADVRFTDAAGNPLSYEIESWNPAGTSYLWVRVPQIAASSSSGYIYLYYGNPGAAAGANAAAVWAGYGGVWHLNGGGADASSNANHGTAVNTTTAAGAIGNALNFNGSSSYVDVLNPVGLSITGTLTGEAWIRVGNVANQGNPRVYDKKSSPWTSAAGYTLEYKPGQRNITELGSGSDLLRAEPITANTAWHYVAAVHLGNGSGRIYQDGVDITTDSTVGQLVADGTRFRIGQQTWGGEGWNGGIDEVRISASARSAAWIRAQNLSMRDTFIAYGAPESTGAGSLTASAALFLAPRTTDITMDSAPSGMLLSINAVTAIAPFTQTVIQNSANQITAAASQMLGGVNYTFAGWSDGGAASHLIAAPAANVTLTATYSSGGGTNTAPSVSITSPANGAVIGAPGAVTITANATDAEGPVQRVEFYVDGALVDTDLSAPFSGNWNATVGGHSLTATAYDGGGLSTPSAAVPVTVNAANTAPSVSITSPANGAVIGAPGAVTITANATDAEGPVQRVEFYVDGALVDTDLSAPFSGNWNATVGGHSLTATAYDGGGLSTPSAAVSVTVSSGGGTGDWWNSLWTRRLKLTLDNSGQAENLSDFQLLVALNGTRLTYADAQANGADVRFTDAAGNPLSYEIESWNPAGTSYLWVRVPQIAASSSSGYIYLYYGNPGAAAGANAAAVWAGYGGVWHLNGGGADASSNANHGTAVNTTTAAGAIGNALNFNGSSSYVDVLNPVGLSITGTLTGEAWIRVGNVANQGNPRVYDKKSSPWTSAAGYTLEYKPGQRNITELGSGSDLLRAEPITANTAWHYVAAVHLGNGSGRIYQDGVDITTDSTVGQLVADGTRFRIGQQTWGGEGWNGGIDEVRISASARSAAWIRAQNLSMRDTFIAYGAPEVFSGGGTNTAPSVSITSPANGAVIGAPGAVTITANATDAEGPVQRVEFYVDGALVDTDLSAPFSGNWNATVGGHSLTATAYDGGGLSTPSAAVPVTVNAANTAPSVSITSPANGAVIGAPGAVTITANATDAEGPVQRVEFYVDGALVDTDLSAPFSGNWNATVGGHSLTATAYDGGGLSTPSAAVSVTVSSGGGTGDWWNSLWTRRLKLTLDNSGQAENLSDFQLLVALNGTRLTYADAQANGADVRFTDAAGNPLSYEIESWNPAGTSYLWVRVPQIAASSSSGYIYLYYGNPGAAAGANAAAVWAGYGGVWHLNGGGADASSNANHGTAVNTTTAAGAIGNALNFNGSSSYVDVLNPVGLSITGTLTGEAWIRVGNVANQGNPRVYDKKSSPWTSAAGYTLEYKPGQRNITELGSGSDLLRAEPITANTAWHYVAAVHLGNGSGRIYQDGVDITTDSTVGQLVADGTRFRIGQQTWGGEGWNGGIDEVRISASARSAAWIRAQNLSMRDTFIAYGAPQAGP